MSEYLSKSEPSPEQWISAVYSSQEVDTGVAENLDPMNSYMVSIVEGRSIDDQLKSELQKDIGVHIKNRLLGFIATLAEDGRYHIGDMLGMMDHQAVQPQWSPVEETRYRQFMGLWDFAVALSKNSELLEELKNQY